MGSLPRLDATVDRLVQIPGQPPSLLRPPRGCRFNPRCSYTMTVCHEKEPPSIAVPGDPGHEDACHLDAAVKQREANELLGMIRGSTGRS